MSQIPSFVLGADMQRSDFLPFSPYEVVSVVFLGGDCAENQGFWGADVRLMTRKGYMMYMIGVFEDIEAHQGPNPPNDVVDDFLVTRPHQLDPQMSPLICTIS